MLPDLVIDGPVTWTNASSTLRVVAQHDIVFTEWAAQWTCAGDLVLQAGIRDPSHSGTIRILPAQHHHPLFVMPLRSDRTSPTIEVHCNPISRERSHKYGAGGRMFLFDLPFGDFQVKYYALVNTVEDLANLLIHARGRYSLSQNIDASQARNWHHGAGFQPLNRSRSGDYFCGELNGNGFAIFNLFIQPSGCEKHVGLFSVLYGRNEAQPAVIRNLELRNFTVAGGTHAAGLLVGSAVYARIENVLVRNSTLRTKAKKVGQVAGYAYGTSLRNVHRFNSTVQWHRPREKNLADDTAASLVCGGKILGMQDFGTTLHRCGSAPVGCVP